MSEIRFLHEQATLAPAIELAAALQCRTLIAQGLFGQRCTDFDPQQPPESAELEPYEFGWIFGKDAEVKWRRIDGLFHLVATTDVAWPEGESLDNWQIAQVAVSKIDDATGTEKVFLWGEQQYQPGTTAPVSQWYDPRIPHLIQETMGYPVQGAAKRIQIVLQYYETEEKLDNIIDWQHGKDEPITLQCRYSRYVKLI